MRVRVRVRVRGRVSGQIQGQGWRPPQPPLVLVGVLRQELDRVPVCSTRAVQVLSDDERVAVEVTVHALVVDRELLEVFDAAQRGALLRVLREREQQCHLAALAAPLLHRHLRPQSVLVLVQP